MNWQIHIALFLVCIILYYKSRIPSRDLLIIVSLHFITFIEPQAAIAVIGLTALTYYTQRNKTLNWTGISLNLVAIIYTNYYGQNPFVFKLGISYYGLQNIGVLLLSLRSKPQNISFRQLLLGNVLFAKFISGPILLPKEITSLNVDNQFRQENLIVGINRIVFGLFKILVLSDNIGLITDTVFGNPLTEFKAITIIIAALLFTLQMYLNFSGYTDVALGFGKLFNFTLKENFNLPLRSVSVSEYWRKTHISLIDWFTQNFFYYFTFKLRKSPIKATLLGIGITFLLSGIWHGVYTGFLIWGGLNALYLMVEYFGKKNSIKLSKIISWPLVILLITFANLFFISKYWQNSVHFLSQIFSIENWQFQWDMHVMAVLGNGGYLEQQFQLVIIGVLVLGFLLFEKRLEIMAKSSNVSILFLSILGILIFLFGNFNDGSEFIYMQF